MSRVETISTTSAQQSMLVHALGDERHALAVEQCVLTLDEHLDPQAHARAWQQAVDACPALRTALVWQGGAEPRLVVHASASLPVTVEDLRGQDADAVEAAIRDQRVRDFDAAQVPAMRVLLLRADAGWVLAWAYHNILLDTWSARRILHAVLADAPQALAAHAPFSDWVAWQNSLDADASCRWWRDALAGFDAPTPLPWSIPDGEGLHARTECLDADTSAALAAAAEQAGLPWSALVEAAWAVLLWRHTGADDEVFGVIQDGRAAAPEAVAGVLGSTISTVPRRVAVRGEQPFRQLLDAVASAQQASDGHAHLGMAGILRASARSGGHHALFHSAVCIEHETLAQALRPVLPGGAQARQHRHIGFPLSLTATGGNAWRLHLEWDAGKLASATAADLLQRLLVVLQAVASEGLDTPVRALPWLTPQDRQDVTERWNDTALDTPFCPVVRSLHRHAELQPSAPAMCGDGIDLSYADLAARVHALAGAMQAAGVQPGQRVAVALLRCPDLIAALLAAHQCGAAYVPCDPDYPAERVQAMLEDSEAVLLVTDQASLARLPDHALPRLMCEDVPDRAAPVDEAELQGDTPAYVIFTSGSTGRPKGVVVTHGNLSNLMHSMARAPGLAAGERMLALASLSFDMAVPEVFLPLHVGAAIVLGTQSHAQDGAALRGLLEREQVNMMQGTPATYRLLRGAGWHPPAGFRALAGGEAVDAALADDLLASAEPDAELWNMYGPTETTVWSCCTRMTGGVVSIGTPMANTRCHVVDAWDEPVAPGVGGELLIGGAGVSLGYLNDADKTRKQFIDNPFGAGRLYRTGDRVRWQRLPDGSGQLLYIERMDFQVKIRGFRVELGEIEARLAQHPGVEQAVVVVRTEGGDRLVAYLTGPDVPTTAELRAWLGERLPAHMVPAQCVALDAFPLTTNGKINRKALPAPPDRVDTGQQIVKPRTDTEHKIAASWCRVLGLSEVGVLDNFFDLGGDSLRLVAVLGQLQDELDPGLRVADLFRHPTVAALAAHVSGGAGRDQTPGQAVDDRAARRRAAAGAASRRRNARR